MSIIYDALKKVESRLSSDSNIAKPKIEKESRRNTKKYLLFIVIVSLGFVIASISFNLLMPSHKGLSKKDIKNSPLQTEPIQGIMAPAENIVPAQNLANSVNNLAAAPPESSQSEKQIQPLLVLNGVFFSENQGYALINNRIVKEGDTVDGAIVERISLDGVDLNSGGLVIKLSTGSQ
jgi:hypothetical protein